MTMLAQGCYCAGASSVTSQPMSGWCVFCSARQRAARAIDLGRHRSMRKLFALHAAGRLKRTADLRLLWRAGSSGPAPMAPVQCFTLKSEPSKFFPTAFRAVRQRGARFATRAGSLEPVPPEPHPWSYWRAVL